MSNYMQSFYMVGNQTTRATLTDTYTDNRECKTIDGAESISLSVEYTMGASETSNSIEVRVRFASPIETETPNTAPAVDSTYWYQKQEPTTSGGTVTTTLGEYSFSAVSAAATYDRFTVNIPTTAKYVEVCVKETGVAANAGKASVKLTTIQNK